MTFTQMNYFLELCRTMSFTKAAQNLYITQPTLSRQIQLLETELNVELVKRNNREVVLTKAGEVFRNEFSRIDDEIEFAIMRVKKATEFRNEINVGFAESVIPSQVIRLVKELQDYFPGYSIKMKQGYYYELKHEFERGMIDLVVSIEEIDCRDWKAEWKKVYELPAYLTYSPQLFPDIENPSIEDFKTKKLIFSSKEGSNKIIDRQKAILKSVGIEVNEKNCLFADEILPALLFTHRKEGYCVFCNQAENDLYTLPLPENAGKFHMMASWNRQTMPHLTKFFDSIK